MNNVWTTGRGPIGEATHCARVGHTLYCVLWHVSFRSDLKNLDILLLMNYIMIMIYLCSFEYWTHTHKGWNSLIESFIIFMLFSESSYHLLIKMLLSTIMWMLKPKIDIFKYDIQYICENSLHYNLLFPNSAFVMK